MELQAQIYQLKETKNAPSLLKLSRIDLSPLEILMSKAFLQGESLFTSLLVERSKAWFIDDHLDRLMHSLHWHFDYSTLQIGMIRQNIEVELGQLSYKAKFEYLRMTFFESGESKYLVLFLKPHQDPRGELSSLELKTFQQEFQFESRRFHKWGNYLDSNLLKKGFRAGQDLLFLDQNESVLELSSSNIFFSDGKNFYTPDLNGDILSGVYRKNLISHLRDNGLKVYEERIALRQIKDFKFAFATNCLGGIREIHSIEQHRYQESDKNFLMSLKRVFY
jgi:branched-subunit amino acid aminotransferase/4-amino-4-deoxychorismate lyase